jgi:gluconate 5-dehydrogenase
MTADVAAAPVVVVTGVSPGGLGFATARGFVAAGARVVASDHPAAESQLRDVVATLGASDASVAVLPADVTDEKQVSRLGDFALASFGRIDALVNCAGVMLRKDVFATTLAEWHHVIEVNLTGTWLLNRAIGQVLCGQRGGSIVNIASVYADRAGPIPESAYYASKAGISNLTRGLAAEFGPHGVTVNCLAPGVFYPTQMTAPLSGDPAMLETMTRRTMLGRLGDPEQDIDGVVRFLVSPAARYITGQTIFVDGGWSAW